MLSKVVVPIDLLNLPLDPIHQVIFPAFLHAERDHLANWLRWRNDICQVQCVAQTRSGFGCWIEVNIWFENVLGNWFIVIVKVSFRTHRLTKQLTTFNWEVHRRNWLRLLVETMGLLLNFVMHFLALFLGVKLFVSCQHLGDLLKVWLQFGHAFLRHKNDWVRHFGRQFAIWLDLKPRLFSSLVLELAISEPVLCLRPVFNQVMRFRRKKCIVRLMFPQVLSKNRVQLVLQLLAQFDSIAT